MLGVSDDNKSFVSGRLLCRLAAMLHILAGYPNSYAWEFLVLEKKNTIQLLYIPFCSIYVSYKALS